MAPEHLVPARDGGELAHGQHLIQHGRLSLPEWPFELDSFRGDVIDFS